MTWRSALFLLLALFSLGVSAFMAASEIAFCSLSSRDLEKIEAAESSRDARLSALLDRSPYLMMEIFIVNNLANMMVIMSGIFFLTEIFDFTHARTGYVLSFLLFVLVILLFGEIVPKVYARQNVLRMVRRAAPVMSLLEVSLGGVAKLMVGSASYIERRFGHKESAISMDELSHAVEMTQATTGEEKEMLQDIVRFGDKTVQEIMTARTDLTDVDIRIDFSSLLQLIVETGYSRIPVYDGSQDNIKGIIYIKDLLPYLSRGSDFDWRHLLRPAYFVPEGKMIDELLEDFRRQHIHMAVVVDEFGGTSGVVTLEDILEEIVATSMTKTNLCLPASMNTITSSREKSRWKIFMKSRVPTRPSLASTTMWKLWPGSYFLLPKISRNRSKRYAWDVSCSKSWILTSTVSER